MEVVLSHPGGGRVLSVIRRISAGTVAFSRIHHRNCMVLHAQLDCVLFEVAIVWDLLPFPTSIISSMSIISSISVLAVHLNM